MVCTSVSVTLHAIKLLTALAIGAAAGAPVTDLPGAPPNGTLSHHAGLLPVSFEEKRLEVFYYFVDHADATAPLVVWMNGGPGASSMMGMFGELGPLLVNGRSLGPDGSVVSLWENAFSWSSGAALVAWEQPAGVGFSRCVDGPCDTWNDTSSAAANVVILEAFYGAHGTAQLRDLFIVGESYGGVYVPMLAVGVLARGSARLRGIGVGNGCIGFGVSGGCGTDSLDVLVSVLERLAPGVSRGALSDARAACPGELDTGKAPHELTPQCGAAMRDLFEELGEYNQYHWASACGADGQGDWGAGDAFACAGGPLGGGVLPSYLARADVQRALHVLGANESTPRKWVAWDGDWDGYNITAADVQPSYRELLSANVSVLVYNGLRDTGVPAVGAEKWVPRVAGTALVEPRRKWGTPAQGGAFAGHVTAYASGLTFATVAGAGHLVPADRPVPALAMLSAFLQGEPLPAYQGAKCKRLWIGRGYGNFCGE